MSKEVTTFVAEDGAEFPTKEECDRHEELQAAKNEFHKAVSAYDLVLAKQFKTGDGMPFTFQRSTYHYVWEAGQGPRIITDLSLYGYYCKVSEDGHVYRDKNSGAQGELERYEIAQLYVSERAAHEKLLELREKYLQWAKDDIEKLKAKIATMRH